MENKLEVGMFVRTNDGYINKIKNVNQYNVLVDGRDLFGEELNIPNNEIVKASHNIIDLIEVGDYVNGHRIEEIDFENEEIFTDSEYYCGVVEFYNIKSVITHEQMEQIAYKVCE